MPPRLALAMTPGLVDAALTDAHWDRLDAVVEVLDRSPLASLHDHRAAQVLADVDVLLAHWGCPLIDAAALDRAPSLRMIAYAAGTVKGVVSEAVWARDILVTSGAAANAVPVAEYTVAAILFANKGAFVSREWFRDSSVRLRRPKPVGNYGKRIGIVGASHVGRKVIELLAPFELEVVVHDPYVDDSVDLDELCATCDVVSIHAPDLPSTEGMIGAAQLAAMKDGAVLVNTARGRLVDPAALEAELATGRISAVLDVTSPEPLPPESPLYHLPNVFLTPHLAGSQGSELLRMADLAVEEIERFARGEPPLHPVRADDLPRIA